MSADMELQADTQVGQSANWTIEEKRFAFGPARTANAHNDMVSRPRLPMGGR